MRNILLFTSILLVILSTSKLCTASSENTDNKETDASSKQQEEHTYDVDVLDQNNEITNNEQEESAKEHEQSKTNLFEEEKHAEESAKELVKSELLNSVESDDKIEAILEKAEEEAAQKDKQSADEKKADADPMVLGEEKKEGDDDTHKVDEHVVEDKVELPASGDKTDDLEVNKEKANDALNENNNSGEQDIDKTDADSSESVEYPDDTLIDDGNTVINETEPSSELLNNASNEEDAEHLKEKSNQNAPDAIKDSINKQPLDGDKEEPTTGKSSSINILYIIVPIVVFALFVLIVLVFILYNKNLLFKKKPTNKPVRNQIYTPVTTSDADRV